MDGRRFSHARLHEAENAHRLLRSFIDEMTLPNLWTVCPPFQIDASLGVIAGVAEMLLQSNQGYIEILPALPKAWHTGHFDGLIARGNFRITAEWKDGVVIDLSIQSRSGNSCRIRLPHATRVKVVDKNGHSIPFKSEGRDLIVFPTEKGMTYKVTSRP